MSESDSSKPTTSDEALVEQTRAGDQRAFAELWRRHFRSGARVARQFTSSIDADDLVSEAYTRIYQRVLAGGGPTGAFRPYLYTTIRNLASTWGAASRDVQVDDIADFEDPDTIEDPAAVALDRTLTARAFRSLPDRWQSVLWYTEVEGMDPHEVAPLLGMSANGVAALSYRAREGLRKAWLQAHINDATASGECQWTISRIGDHARNGLSARDSERMGVHLATCTKCAIISEEVDEVGSRLALVMVPILLGGIAGGTFLGSFGHAGSAMAASADAIPALPEAITAGAAAAAGAAGALGLFTAPVALVGTLALAVAVSGSVVALAPVDAASDETTYSVSEPDPEVTEAVPQNQGPFMPVAELPVDPSDIPGAPGEVVDGANVVDVVDSVIDTVTGGTPPEGHTAPGGIASADVSLNLTGSGTPGAHLSLQAAGQVYATTTVGSDGTFVLNATAIPGGLASLDLVQTVDREYLSGIVLGQNPLAQLLGIVDGLVNSLIQPLNLWSGGTSGVNIQLLS
ncbi:MAG: sigma-70 family polymerase sigma factor [Rhodoglobus sp.]|nr:sigma-70 family polymerase sigma factor [Rhodoglobus sp.]